jgi:hypothetical protein
VADLEQGCQMVYFKLILKFYNAGVVTRNCRIGPLYSKIKFFTKFFWGVKRSFTKSAPSCTTARSGGLGRSGRRQIACRSPCGNAVEEGLRPVYVHETSKFGRTTQDLSDNTKSVGRQKKMNSFTFCLPTQNS